MLAKKNCEEKIHVKLNFYLKASLLLEEVLNLVFLKVQRVDSILEGKILDILDLLSFS